MRATTLIRASVYLLLYVGLPVIAALIGNESVTVFTTIVYIFVLMPVGILQSIEFYRSNDGTTLMSRVFNLLFRIPLALFGLLCVIVGAGIVCWVLYNIFVERQKEYTGPTIILGLASFGVGVPLILYGWFTLWSAFRRKTAGEPSPEQVEEFENEENDEERAV